MRIVTVIFSIVVTLYAMYSELSIFSMVENAYQSTLVIAFVPLVFGLYWKRANKYGAYSAITLGVVTWIGLSLIGFETLQPHFCGLIAATIGMIVGSLVKKENPPIEVK
jgi:Na+/proline symporter